jgi:hypothetical protein
MTRNFPPSIYAQPRAAPSRMRQSSRLDAVREHRRQTNNAAAMQKMWADVMLFGSGFVKTHVPVGDMDFSLNRRKQKDEA